MRLLLFLAAILVIPLPAFGQLTLVPVSISPVTIDMDVRAGFGTTYVTFNGTGTSSAAVVDQPFSVSPFDGVVTGVVTVEADSIVVVANAANTRTIVGGSAEVTATVVIDMVVPELGGSTTPIAFDVETIAEAWTEWAPPTVNASLPNSKFHSLSTNQTMVSGNFVAGWSAATGSGGGSFALLPAGDTIQLTLSISQGSDVPSGVIGGFESSYRIRFRTRQPTIGTGDINGDGSFNVVDVTILRRILAGDPVP